MLATQLPFGGGEDTEEEQRALRRKARALETRGTHDVPKVVCGRLVRAVELRSQTDRSGRGVSMEQSWWARQLLRNVARRAHVVCLILGAQHEPRPEEVALLEAPEGRAEQHCPRVTQVCEAHHAGVALELAQQQR